MRISKRPIALLIILQPSFLLHLLSTPIEEEVDCKEYHQDSAKNTDCNPGLCTCTRVASAGSCIGT
jgi:hypothetical protein